MRLEILCTGNELLDGSVVDTNSPYLMERTLALGLPVLRKETVPDDLEVIADAMRTIGARADVLIVSGGLGPTTDDLTVDAAALAAGVPLETDEAMLAHIKERFSRRGVTFTANNARLARVPKGGVAVTNPFGSAPMIALKVGKAEVFLLPGVPREFRGLCDQEIVPRLRERVLTAAGHTHLALRILKTYGIPESHLDELMKELPQRHPHVKLGFRTHAPENHLKLFAEGPSPEDAGARLAAAEAEARALLGHRCFGADAEEFPAAVLASLQKSGATLALAESCTAGLCASLLADVSGASRTLVSSAVVYQDQAKTQLLGVDAELVRRESAVSAPVTRALAEAARAKAGATYGLAITGWAGPGGGTERDPVGTVYIALAGPRGLVEQRHRFGFDRARVRLFAAYQALDLLRLEAEGVTP